MARSVRIPNTYLDNRKDGLIAGDDVVVDPSARNVIVLGTGNVVGPTAQNVLIIGNNVTVPSGVDNVVVFGDGITASTSNTLSIDLIVQGSTASQVPVLVIPHDIAADTGATFSHNLGYIPVFSLTQGAGNRNVSVTFVDNNEIAIYNYNTGGNTSAGDIYLYQPSMISGSSLQPVLIIPHDLAANSGTTFNHNLGYIPVFAFTQAAGNVNFHVTSVDDTTISVWNYNTGGNTSAGDIYLWAPSFVSGSTSGPSPTLSDVLLAGSTAGGSVLEMDSTNVIMGADSNQVSSGSHCVIIGGTGNTLTSGFGNVLMGLSGETIAGATGTVYSNRMQYVTPAPSLSITVPGDYTFSGLTGNDMGGYIRLTVGATAIPANTAIGTITWTQPFITHSGTIFKPLNANAADVDLYLVGGPFVFSASGVGIINRQALSPSTTYDWVYNNSPF